MEDKSTSTIENRIQIYKSAIILYENGTIASCCYVLARLARISMDLLNIEKYFPEFYEQKPKNKKDNRDYWWKVYDVESRIEALKAAIKRAEKKL